MQTTTLMVNPQLLTAAKNLKINLSATFEAALLKEVLCARLICGASKTVPR